MPMLSNCINFVSFWRFHVFSFGFLPSPTRAFRFFTSLSPPGPGPGAPSASGTWPEGSTHQLRLVVYEFIQFTLQGTNMSPKNGILKMIFLFPRWDMLIPWRVSTIIFRVLAPSKTVVVDRRISEPSTL